MSSFVARALAWLIVVAILADGRFLDHSSSCLRDFRNSVAS